VSDKVHEEDSKKIGKFSVAKGEKGNAGLYLFTLLPVGEITDNYAKVLSQIFFR
jgi:hypothetical protein